MKDWWLKMIIRLMVLKLFGYDVDKMIANAIKKLEEAADVQAGIDQSGTQKEER